MTDFIQVVTTVDSKDKADEIAASLMEGRLAGCVQVSGPVTSTYRWQGKVETDEEWCCVAKTATRIYEDVEKAIRELHPYDEPEILAVPVAAGSQGYLTWLTAELGL